MRQLKLFFVLTVMLLGMAAQASAASPRKAWSDSENAFLLLARDGSEEYTVDGTITFKAVADGSTIAGYRDCGVVFAPANEGEILQITVNSIDLASGNYLLLYDGAVEKIGQSDYSRTGTQSKYLPDGWVKWYTSESVGETYTSTAADGKLSFGFHSSSANGQKGFNITVTSLSPKDMEYVSTDVMTGLANTYRAAKDQTIFGVNVKMDGGSNPMKLNTLTIGASALNGSTQVSNVRLVYRGETLATAATVGSDLTAADVTLRSGNNEFLVVADVLPDAAGSIPSLSLSKVTVADVERTPLNTTGEALAIDNIILMPADATTFTIGDDAKFYDDGGKDGKITLNFNGQVTFVPATAGNSIKVDFSKLALFSTSTIGKNDILKFYSGREAKEENLITTLLTEAEVVKSTAEDGSMTVTLNSTTGIAAEGWEAVVSQFLPGDMTFKGVSGTAASTATVAAGEKDVQLLVIDVQTDNTANALTVTGINVNAADTKNIEKVRAYYLGKKNTFDTANRFGEVEVSGNAIALTGSQELIEGHNYFAIVADLNQEGLNGDVVTLALNGVVVNAATQTPAEAVSASRTIENICRAVKGSHGHVIKDTWQFTNAEGYSGKYEADGDADYIVTFTPAEAGTVAEINFSKFDVYYASSSISTQAVFEIYAGNSVNAENLLWNLKSNSEASVGPGKIIRSTAADGSLTIRFNPKTSSSYYAGTGWMATVQPFRNHEMTVEEIVVNQTSSDVVAVGSADAALIDFDVITEGTLSIKVLNAVKLDLKNSQDAVSKVNVYYNNVDDRATAVAFGTVENPATSAITVAGERELAEGHNYFWVTADIKANAPAEAVVDAKLTALVDASGVETTVENGDPEGERTVKYLYVMQSGDNGVIVITDPLLFYDNGGKDGKIASRFSGTVTFVPGRENSAVQINTNTFSMGNGYFYVYSGREASEANALGKINGYGTTSGPENLVSKAEDGSLTVKVSGPSGTTLDGFEIEVSLHEKTPFTVEAIEGEPTNDDVMRNSQDNLMQRICLNVSGDKNPLNVTAVKFDATGTTSAADIAAAKVYYTEHKTAFGTGNLLGSISTVAAGENVITFSEPLTISDNGDYYLWLTYDIAAEATVGNAATAQIKGVTVAENEMTLANALLANRTIKGGLKGNYIIGASDNANYANFAAAIAALQGGVEGAVTFQVEDGDYAENVVFESIPGAGAQNTITFTSLSGNRDNVVVKGSGTVVSGQGMVNVTNTPYVTFENMSFIPANQSYPAAVRAADRCHYFTVRGCRIVADRITSGYSGMNLIYTVAGAEDGMTNDHNVFENNTLEGGYIGIYLYGPSNFTWTKHNGLTIKGNTVSETRSKGLYVLDYVDAVIEGNTITNTTTTATNYTGIDIYRNRGAFVVRDNVVTNEHSAYSSGIYMRQECRGDDNAPALVYNNVVSITKSPNNNGAGLQVNSDSKNIHIYYNTVAMAGTAGYAFYNGGNAVWSGIKMQNNLFQNLTTGGLGAALFNSENNVKAVDMQNNVFFNAKDSVIIKDYAANIEALNTLVGNTTNTVERAQFLSDVDLHLRAQGNLRSALPVDFITVDADGKERDANNPTIGAYEYVEISEETPEIAEGYPVVSGITENSADVKTKWTVSGKLYSQVVKATEPEQGAAAPRKAPTAADLKAGSAQSVTADNEVTTTFSGLDDNTKYEAYFLNVSALGKESEVVKAEFTTARYIAPLEASLPKVTDTIAAGEQAVLVPAVAGGDLPYTYEWRDQMNQVVGTDSILTVKPTQSYAYRLTVTSADGQTAKAKTGVYVEGETLVGTFEDNYLADESFFNGDNADDEFYTGSYAFQAGNAIWPGSTISFWYGYALSNQTSTEYKVLDDQYHAITGGGMESKNFAIAYPSGYGVLVTNKEEGDTIPGMYVTNTAYAYSSMTEGDGYARAFRKGDYLKVTATGTTATGTTASTEFYLGDAQAEQAADRYVLNTWEWIDLRPLGKVKKVTFTFTGTDVGTYGLNTPTYFAIDNFGSMPIAAEAEKTVNLGVSEIDLADLFEHADNGATEVYRLDKPLTDEVMDVTLGEAGKLNVNGKQNQASRTVLVAMTAKGHTQWVRLTINVDNSTAIGEVSNGRTVSEVKYVDVMGRVSDHPFEGVNVVVTRYSDGSVTTVKVKK